MRAIQLTYTNESAGYQFGSEILPLDDSTTYGGDDATMGEIYREATLRQHLGRCVSRVFKDTDDGAEHIGWFFVGREAYEDTGESYLRGTWLVVGQHRPAVAEGVI